jgi:hypothetical protein
LFIQLDGAPFSSRFFLHICLRPTLKLLQAAGTHGGKLHEVDIDTRITTNSLRRGGNTAAANAGVRRELRMGQARWKAPMGQIHHGHRDMGKKDLGRALGCFLGIAAHAFAVSSAT